MNPFNDFANGWIELPVSNGQLQPDANGNLQPVLTMKRIPCFFKGISATGDRSTLGGVAPVSYRVAGYLTETLSDKFSLPQRVKAEVMGAVGEIEVTPSLPKVMGTEGVTGTHIVGVFNQK